MKAGWPDRPRWYQDYRIFVSQAEYINKEEQSVRITSKYKLKPTPQQECLLERTLMHCRHVYNAAFGERKEAWRMRGVSVTYYQQKAELPGIKAEMPEYGEVNSRSCRTWYSVWTTPIKPSSIAYRQGRIRAFPASRGATATPASPTRR